MSCCVSKNKNINYQNQVQEKPASSKPGCLEKLILKIAGIALAAIVGVAILAGLTFLFPQVMVPIWGVAGAIGAVGIGFFAAFAKFGH